MQLKEFIGRIPKYAILSHTWGTDEVTLQDMQGDSAPFQSRPGFHKVEATCRQAERDGLEYAWVDSCCIDKTSSAELSEAINSMYRWYQGSSVCYAHLEDVFDDRLHDVRTSRSPSSSAFASSRWFSRGWTLQELIAPSRVEFYNSSWQKLAEKSNIVEELQGITGIDEFVLLGGSPQRVSLGRRMSWAAGRKTTREEDVAYSLLGIFDVNIPLLYGEGSSAFTRLQEKILKQSDDHTLFAWRATLQAEPEEALRGLLAESPDEFANFRDWSYHRFRGVTSPESDNIVQVWPRSPVDVSKRGIHFSAKSEALGRRSALDILLFRGHAPSIILPLNCSVGGDPQRVVGIYLQLQDGNRYARSRPSELADLAKPEGKPRALCGIRATSELRIGYYDNPWAARPPDEVGVETLHVGATALTPRRNTMADGYYLCGIFTAEEERGPLRCYSYQHEYREGRALNSDLFLQLQRHRQWTLMLKGRSEGDIVLVTLWASSRDLRFDAVRIPLSQLQRDSGAITSAIQAFERPSSRFYDKSIPMTDCGRQLSLRLRETDMQGRRTWDLDIRMVDRRFWIRTTMALEATFIAGVLSLGTMPGAM
ncbi:Vegetative incompatibility protein HET-E-1-like protein 13 [Colletotrichum chlorophyti]|uniref:Vegetative incompatibility protein HET-E-1-like protein 13 n=1 Tax=Colletotrichum chlorophyti TaxID=708187 RepID=A0A1Q8RSI5_9PEZI|nr:Vegetative incompatibility protein HET-E-1-like protein 13 [Colletotrichum chlorophyti]